MESQWTDRIRLFEPSMELVRNPIEPRLGLWTCPASAQAERNPRPVGVGAETLGAA